MQRDVQERLLERLIAHLDAPNVHETFPDSTIETRVYTDDAILAGERRALFRSRPVIVAHGSELPSAGDFVTADVAGMPVLVVRGADGRARAFVNACRHRGTRLVDAASGNVKKAFVCRYHAWTYDLKGSLTHVPQAELFPSLDCDATGLRALPIAEMHGFLWVVPAPGDVSIDVAQVLGAELEADFAAFGFERHHALRKVVHTTRCNWKLVLEAFLEGYHAKYLHHATIARFFLTNGAVFELFGPNLRFMGARRELREARSAPPATWDIRVLATLVYFVFPNTILVLHPDWVSHITMTPLTTSTATYTHTMLTPKKPETPDEAAHWDKTFGLIEDAVFQREDLAISEAIQSTLASDADAHFRLGSLEFPIRHFHDEIARALASTPSR